MLNLIEHLWQLQIPDCRIVTKQSPKLYFYSDKQRRVLRKKQHTVQACLSFLKEKYSDGHFLVLKILHKNVISPSLILLSQLSTLIQKDQYSGTILGIDLSEQLQNIYLCECNFASKIFQTKILMHKTKGIWLCSQKVIDAKEKGRITEQVIKICNSLLLKLKIKQKCKVFNVILGISEPGKDIFWIWCNNFEWSGQSFYQIKYEWQKMSIEQDEEQRENIYSVYLGDNNCVKVQVKKKEEQRELKQYDKSKQGNIYSADLQRCRGCDNMADKNTTKQVVFEQIVSLRRKKKISLMGIKQQYAVVCEKCYFLLQEISDDL